MASPVRRGTEASGPATTPTTIPQPHAVSRELRRTKANAIKRADVTVTRTVTVTTTVVPRRVVTTTVTTTVFSTVFLAPNAETTVTVVETVVLPLPSSTVRMPESSTPVSASKTTGSLTPTSAKPTTQQPSSSSSQQLPTLRSTPFTTMLTRTTPNTASSTPSPTSNNPLPTSSPSTSPLTTAQIAGIAVGATLFLLFLLGLAAYLLRRRLRSRRQARAQENILQQLGPPTPLQPVPSPAYISTAPLTGAAVRTRSKRNENEARGFTQAALSPTVSTGPGSTAVSGGHGSKKATLTPLAQSQPEAQAEAEPGEDKPDSVLDAASSPSSVLSFSEGRYLGLTGENEVRIVIRRAQSSTAAASADTTTDRGTVVTRDRDWPGTNNLRWTATPSSGGDSAGWSMASQRGSEVDVESGRGAAGQGSLGRAWWRG